MFQCTSCDKTFNADELWIEPPMFGGTEAIPSCPDCFLPVEWVTPVEIGEAGA